GDESFERLRVALDELAIGEASELLAEARAEARVRVRSMLGDALTHAMLEHAHEQLQRADRQPAPQPETRGERAWYVYGVIASERAAAITAIDGAAVVQEGDLAAVVGRVALDEFDEQRLREHLADIDWVERT